MTDPTPARLRDLARDATLRPRDLAAALDIPEAALVQAHLGHGAIRITPAPGRLIPAVAALGEVMALTRNASCVIEKIGTYNDFHDGDHAAMTVDPEIDLRMFPRHWVHAYAVELGNRRSVQVFDAAGDAIHKVHLLQNGDSAAWTALCAGLALPDQTEPADFGSPAPTDPARAAPDKAEILRAEWAGMTDTHQFNALLRRLKMNRLGAYRIVGAPHARALPTTASDALFRQSHRRDTQVMLFVGNPGCIQIHSGPIRSLKPVGPWLNVLDDRFNLHLRTDHVAEVWAVSKPTRRGPALSVEVFDAEGGLIFQCFGLRADKDGDPAAWADLVAGLFA